MASTTTSVYVDPNTGGVQAGLMNFRNKIINGNFDVWQRGTTFGVANGAFYADRWRTIYDGTGATRTISQQGFALGQTEVPGNPKYFLRMAVTVVGTGSNYLILEHPIESVSSLSGKMMTMSFWAKSSIAVSLQNVLFAQFFNSSSATFTTMRENIPITTSWSYYTVTGRVPSISGKTIGANDYLGIRLYLPINQVFEFDLAQVQVEDGQKATPFEVRPYPVELQLCQRYYCAIPNFNGIAASGEGRMIATNNGTNANLIGGTIYFPAMMRASPTVTFFGGNVSTGNVSYYTAGSGAQAGYSIAANNIMPQKYSSTMLSFATLPTTIGANYSAWIDMGWAANNLGIKSECEL